jgi:hypothetical protein
MIRIFVGGLVVFLVSPWSVHHSARDHFGEQVRRAALILVETQSSLNDVKKPKRRTLSMRSVLEERESAAGTSRHFQAIEFVPGSQA